MNCDDAYGDGTYGEGMLGEDCCYEKVFSMVQARYEAMFHGTRGAPTFGTSSAAASLSKIGFIVFARYPRR